MNRLLTYLPMILTAIAFAVGSSGAKAQKIYSTQSAYQADVKVYVVDKEYRADLVVYFTDREYRAKANENKGIWFVCDRPYRADKKVFFTDHEYQADIKIYITDKEYRAGWKKNEKKPLMYGSGD